LGLGPTAEALSFACPKESTERKRHPTPRPYGIPCAARQGRRLRTRPNRPKNAACRGAQTVLAENSCLACAAQRGVKGKEQLSTPPSPTQSLPVIPAKAGIQQRYKTIETIAFPRNRDSQPNSLPDALSSAAGPGAFGNHLFELRDSLRFVQAVRVSLIAARLGEQRKEVRSTVAEGVFSFGSFFWTSKRKNLACRGETRPPLSQHTTSLEYHPHAPQGFLDQFQKGFAGCKCNTSY
jgi:hypothetical protein